MRSIGSDAAMEEERRLCYVGMTRAEKRLYLSWAKYRRRFGGGEQERSIASRFLKEVPANLMVKIGGDADEDGGSQVDLTPERHEVRQSAKRNVFTGKTYNSIENISQFFAERGVKMPVQTPVAPPPKPPIAPPPGEPSGAPPWATRPPAAPQFPPRAPASAPFSKPAAPNRPARAGTVIEHPKYGTGTVVRREGEGEDAKITVMFPRYGLKKLIEKYAGIKTK
jgi:DNA helicase-2/ATP-dependent DNA helicase PcrA